MHQLFRTNEMVLHILMCLYPGDNHWDWFGCWGDVQAIVHFAFTSRAMFEIAMPLIWRCRDDFMYLLLLLPRDLYRTDSFHSLEEHWEFQKELFVSAICLVVTISHWPKGC